MADLDTTFTGSQLREAVNDKLSRSDGGKIGNTSIDPINGIMTNKIISDDIKNSYDIPYRGIKIMQYVGDGAATRDIILGYKPSCVIIATGEAYPEDYAAISNSEMFFMTPTQPSRSALDGTTLYAQITDDGFEVRYFETPKFYCGPNLKDKSYTAIIFS